jgi:hypothetical protein
MVMTDEEQAKPASQDEQPSGDEAERLREQWTFSPEEWREAVDRHRAKEEQRAQEIFGDQQPFPIPDADTDT